MTTRHEDLVAALLALPERELVEMVGIALASRSAEVAAPEYEEARLCLVEAHRFRDASGEPSSWELLLLARPEETGAFVTEGLGPTQEGGCCGVVLAAFAKRIVCPLCAKPATAT